MRSSEGETWLDDEQLAYAGYAGGLNASRRRARVRCPDGILRVAIVGIPDTFFSIPAKVKAYGKTVSGFVHVEETPQETREYVFTPYLYRKNARVFDRREEHGE